MPGVIAFLRERMTPEQRHAVRLRWNRRYHLQRFLASFVSHRLDLLAQIYGTDKSSRVHGYTRWYSAHLQPHRREVRSVLEIGVGWLETPSGYDPLGGGQSLRMWQSYFPRALIVGIDIETKRVQGRRIRVERGSQDDGAFLERIAAEYGPFDLVVDDGSHLGRHVRASFEVLFEHVKPGGVYVIEDLMTAYDAGWEGGPPGTPGTHVELVKDLIDQVLVRHWGPTGHPCRLDSVHVYDEIAFIHRSQSSCH